MQKEEYKELFYEIMIDMPKLKSLGFKFIKKDIMLSPKLGESYDIYFENNYNRRVNIHFSTILDQPNKEGFFSISITDEIRRSNKGPKLEWGKGSGYIDLSDWLKEFNIIQNNNIFF